MCSKKRHHPLQEAGWAIFMLAVAICGVGTGMLLALANLSIIIR